MKIETKILKTEQLPMEKLTPFQGGLKKLSQENRNKLRKVILENGFAFTIHVWEHAGKIFIIDGHQRVDVMKGLQAEGHKIPLLNCAFQSIKDIKEAKKIVGLSISQYGKIDKAGFFEFYEGEGISFEDYSFPDFKWKEKEPKPEEGEGEGAIEINADDFQNFQHTCPKCKYEWSD